MLERALKNTIVLCSGTSNDLCVVINGDTTYVGILNATIDREIDSDYGILEKGFMILEPVNNTFVAIRMKDSIKGVKFDLAKNPAYAVPNKSDDPAISIWQAIFKRVKNEVHGTICLIVDPDCDWDLANKIFVENVEKIDDLSLNPESFIASSSTDVSSLNKMIDIFISMLNYDGITIIDTSGNIISYHVFVKSSKSSEEGGARNRAFNALKAVKKAGFKAIYLQTQEGKIKTYIFDTKTEIDGQFDASIMSHSCSDLCESENTLDSSKDVEELTTDDPNRILLSYAIQEVKKYRENAVTEDRDITKKEYYSIYNATNDLHYAHNGFSNFYTEPQYARNLCFVIAYEEDILEKHEVLCNRLINTVLECYVGNSYGVSNEAIPYLIDIMEKIPMFCWERYFVAKAFLDREFIGSILVRGVCVARFKKLKIRLKRMNIDTEKCYLFRLEEKILLSLVEASNMIDA